MRHPNNQLGSPGDMLLFGMDQASIEREVDAQLSELDCILRAMGLSEETMDAIRLLQGHMRSLLVNRPSELSNETYVESSFNAWYEDLTPENRRVLYETYGDEVALRTHIRETIHETIEAERLTRQYFGVQNLEK